MTPTPFPRRHTRTALLLGGAAAGVVLAACTMERTRPIDLTRSGETQTETTTSVVAVYRAPDLDSPQPHAPRVALQKEAITVERFVERPGQITTTYAWGGGDALEYVVFDVLVVPRLVVGFIGGIVTGTGLVDPPGSQGLRGQRSSTSRYLYLNPLIDFLGRVGGSGLRDKLGRGTNANFAVPPPLADDYVLNFVDWFGWFVPGYPVWSSSVDPTESEPTELAVVLGEEKPGSRRVELAAEYVPPAEAIERYRFLVDGTPVDQLPSPEPMTLTEAPGSSVAIDLAPWLKRQKWMARAGRSDRDPAGRSRHAFVLSVLDPAGAPVPLRNNLNEPLPAERAVAEANVNWRVPIDAPLPPGLESAMTLTVVDAAGNAVPNSTWTPGARAIARLLVRNNDGVDAWRVAPTWNLPANAEAEITIVARNDQPIERLAPGEEHTFTLELLARPDWVWPGEFELAAQLATRPAMTAKVATVSAGAPVLEMATLAWEEVGSDRDGVLNPGEAIFVKVMLANARGGIGRDARATLVDAGGAGFGLSTADQPAAVLAIGETTPFRYLVTLPRNWTATPIGSGLSIPGLRIRLEERNPAHTIEVADDVRLAGTELFNRPIDVILAEAGL